MRLIVANVLDWLVKMFAPEMCNQCRREEHRHSQQTGRCLTPGCECNGPIL